MWQNETVEDVLHSMGHGEQPKRAEPFTPATLPETPTLPAPGIYFNVPDTDYFSWPALSSHGAKDLAASPMLYWAKATWLSEAARKREAEEANKPEKRIYRTIGKAKHCRLLEGREAFNERFCVGLTAEDCKDALESTDQIKAAIAYFKEKPVSKVADEMDGMAYTRAARKEDWINQLEALDKTGRFKILDRLKEQHGRANAGKTMIPADAFDQLEIAAAIVEADPQAKHAVRGGYPEVSLVWSDKDTGVPMKARVDRLKLKAIVDLKTIGNERGRSIERAIASAISSYHYPVQACFYVEGVQAVKELWRNGQAQTDADDKQRKWLDEWAAQLDEPEWYWLFVQTGIAPINRIVRFPLASVTRKITDEIVRVQKQRFREFSERFNTDMWLDVAPLYDINDDDLYRSVTEI